MTTPWLFDAAASILPGRPLRDERLPAKVELQCSRPCQHPVMTSATNPGSSAPMPAIRRRRFQHRTNLAKGRRPVGAFDLPTQTGYDSDHVLARGEVGKVGVPVSHIGDMRTLFDDIPLATMNTSMTINATAAWLLALYVAVADEQGAPRASLCRHHAERHHQGISVARHLCVPARALDAADHRHHRLFHQRSCRSGTR